MYKVTAKDIMDSVEVLKKLMEKDLKAKTSYKISRLVREVEKELNEINKTYQGIVTKYGEPSEENSDQYMVKEGNIEEYNKEINEFLMSEVELNVNKIPIEELENENFTPTEIIKLEPFMEIGE